MTGQLSLFISSGVDESGSPFHVRSVQFVVSKYSPGTEFVVPSPLWLLLLVPGLDWNGATFPGTLLLEHFWSLKNCSRQNTELCEHGSKIQSAKLHKCVLCFYNLRVKVCNKNLQQKSSNPMKYFASLNIDILVLAR